ncbi:hypothetical protein TNCV_518061 [Trichonephila clavipes]|nr:hypothetical protein TNCV_518061 [Trichonephila clavipes]
MYADSENGLDVTPPFFSPTSRRSSGSTVYGKEASLNSIHCVGFHSHMWAANDLNEKECWPVLTKTHPQCQWDKAIYSPPDGEQIQRSS